VGVFQLGKAHKFLEINIKGVKVLVKGVIFHGKNICLGSLLGGQV